MFTSAKNTISRLFFGFLFIYLLVGSLDFTGNSCFSNKHHKLNLSYSSNDTNSLNDFCLTNFIIEEEDVKENEFKKNCSWLTVILTNFINVLNFDFFKTNLLCEFLCNKSHIPLKKLLQLNCTLRI